jgi:hypothetical protein
VLVGERIDALKAERHETETALARLVGTAGWIPVDVATPTRLWRLQCGSLPDLSTPLANADPELRRRVYKAFQFDIELTATPPKYD